MHKARDLYLEDSQLFQGKGGECRGLDSLATSQERYADEFGISQMQAPGLATLQTYRSVSPGATSRHSSPFL